MKNKIKISLFILTLATITFFGPVKKTVFAVNAVTVEDIRAEIKCPDHDRPEIVSLVEGLINEGKSKEDILTAVADKFGVGVLTNPGVQKTGIMPFMVPAIVLIVAFLLVFGYIKKWINKGEKTYQQEKEMVNAAKGLSDYEKRFEEEFARFKKEE